MRALGKSITRLQEKRMSVIWSQSIEGVDWEELSALYLAAPLGHKAPADLEVAFSNSMFTCFAFESERLVGAGRVLADGVDCAYICDMAVHPTQQGKGVGKAILTDLVKRSRGHRKIILYAVPGKEPFYQRLGFKRMTTAMAIFEDEAGALKNGYIKES
jgi:ribosomal protein S18 acetylase RimI-like enzyme